MPYECFELAWSYYGLQLGVIFTHSSMQVIMAWRAQRQQQPAPPLLLGDQVFERIFWCLWILVVIIGPPSLVPCRVESQEQAFFLWANCFLIATLVGVAAGLLLSDLQGPLVRFSCSGGICFLLGVIVSGGVWPNPKKDWLFWAIFLGSNSLYGGLWLRYTQHLPTRSTQ